MFLVEVRLENILQLFMVVEDVIEGMGNDDHGQQIKQVFLRSIFFFEFYEQLSVDVIC